MSRINHLCRRAKRLWRSERGAVAPLVGVCAIMLVGAVGVAIDVGRGQVAQSKLQAALDSAGLAAGAVVGQNVTEEKLKPEARKYLDANFVGVTVDADITDFDLDLSEDKSVVTLSAKASLPTTFMQIFGEKSMQVAARTEITRETTGLEVALVLDTTGSMDDPVSSSDSTKKIDALKSAATDLVGILFGSHETVDDLYVGIVPFAQAVNVGTSRTAWSSDYATRSAKTKCFGRTSGSSPKCPTSGNAGVISTTISTDSPTKPSVSTHGSTLTLVDDWLDATPSSWYFKSSSGVRHKWGGCFEERYTDGNDVTDATPESSPFKVYLFPDYKNSSEADNTTSSSSNNWLDNSNGNYNVSTSADRSANKSCPTTPVTVMTNTKSTLTSAITALSARGNTILPTGLAWGWRLISPSWRGKWGGTMATFNLPLDYDEPLSQKAVIFMTDGKNDVDPAYGPYGPLAAGHLGTTNETTAETVKLKDKTLAVCSAMKAKGIIIYTLVFGSGSNTATKTMMKQCASEDDFFFDSPSKEALQSAFQAIGDSLSKLRVSK